MRRHYVLGSAVLLLGAALAAGWIVRSSATPPPQQVIARNVPAGENGPGLPLSQVVLFSSGVGYFQREGEVEGNARVDLQFPIGDVNDLLKSLVIQDTGKGKIGIISYDGQDPVDKTLRSFAVDLTGNPTFGQLLNQARGEKVEVVMQQSATAQPGTISGTVMGMESEMQPVGTGGAMREIHMLNLVSPEGVRSVNLREVQRLRFLNPRMEGELRKALDVLAASHDALKKQVSLNFKGEGKRKVKVGYVAENPIWKTSYRLSVNESKGKVAAQLQGWAAVENVTDEDWNDVRVVLVSGRPISYQMDLYPPLFVPRQVVEPEKFAALRPPSYGGALTRSKVDDMMAAGAMNPIPQMPAGLGGGLGLGGGGLGGGFAGLPGGNAAAMLGQQGGQLGFGGGQFGQVGQLGNNMNRYQNVNPGFNLNFNRAVTPNDSEEDGRAGNNARLNYEQFKARREQQQQALQQTKEQAKVTGEKIANAPLDPHGKLAAEAASEDLGGYVRYVIDEKISLPRQKSALLPLLDKSIEAQRVCIFNESVHAKFPVQGLRVKNSSGQPLTQGPITVYEEGGYAGDARLPDLQPNEERLISYAIDLGVEVKAESRQAEGPVMAVSVLGDRLHVSYTSRQTKKYTVSNRSPHDRLLVIEHPVREGWDLANTVKPRETSREFYRFDVPVPAGKDLVFEVAEEQPRSDQFAGRAQPEKDGARVVLYPTTVGLHVELGSRDMAPQLERVRVVKGDIQVTTRQRVDQSYRVINPLEKESREVTVRHRVGQGWRVVGSETPQAKDATLKLAPGKDGRVDVANERSNVAIWPGAQVPVAEMEKLLKHAAVSDPAKAAIKKIVEQRAAIDEQKAQLAEVEKRLKEIGEEQDRLRKNIANLPATSVAHKRYLEKFDKQETEIESLQDQLKKLKAAEVRKEKEFADLLPTLNAE